MEIRKTNTLDILHHLISLCHSTENKLKKWCELVSCTSHNPQQQKGQAKKKKRNNTPCSLSLYLIFLLYPVCSVLMGSAQQPPP
jgi:hypothetical protein